ncbi:LacI family DNA-binding transcriptional regulator [uncultured Clostridium sp.]|uniref:LacI family DNA-binding transcriptional regulator n=1 Tax=uncultured Clostridium sp. TaxID=59620 RepID=UPI0026067977|nr:LacI family DNA-binding transcriptional regulator [uncultured Clostridium sp.]
MNIKDIAELAGVGVGTVSRVINNHPDVKDETREKIKKIIEESNYIPNNSARNLKMMNSNTIGVLTRGVFNPFFSEIVDIIEKRINQNGYTMLLRHTDYSAREIDEVRNLIEFQNEVKLQGIIYLGCDIKDVKEDTFKDIKIPLVLASTNSTYDINFKTFSYVGIQQVQSAFNATEYLIKNGGKKIGIVLGIKEDIGLGLERLQGYLEALRKYKIEIKDGYIKYGGYTMQEAYKVTKELILNNEEIDSIFCISDIMAVGVAKAINDLGKKIGEEISLIGFDGMEITEFYNPAITTIMQPRDEIAEKSIEILLDNIRGSKENKHVVLDTKLIERSSVRNFRVHK